MGSKKVLLVFPGEMFLPIATRKWPLNESLLALYSYLRAHGVDRVEVVDLTLEPIRFPTSAEDLPRFETDCEQILAALDFDVAAISSFSTYSFQSAMLLGRICRRIRPDSTIVVGGWHALTHASDFATAEGIFDLVVIGYGERVLLSIARGEFSRNGGETRILKAGGPLPGEHPWLDYAFADYEVACRSRYGDRIASLESLTVSISRGCPYECDFCANSQLDQRRWEVAKVEETIELLARAAGAFPRLRCIYFSEALFGMSKRWRREFLKRLPGGLPGMDFMLITRSDILDEEDVRLFRTNRVFVVLGMESLSTRMLEVMNKTRDPAGYIERARALVADLGRHGVPHEVFLILDHPGETVETMDETLARASEFLGEGSAVSAFRYIHLPQFALRYPGYRERFRTEFRGRLDWWREPRSVDLRSIQDSYVPSKEEGESFEAARERFAGKVRFLESSYARFERKKSVEDAIEEVHS
ncbi:MAG: radical SAM protein [Planctomycetes bacterium]|nr:radical SAM protein [Planctomycetota bacterium]